MGIGQDKIAREIFTLEPTTIVDLFRLYPDSVNEPSTYFNIHNGAVFGKGITWQQEDYMPVAMEYEGFEVSSDGRPNRPLIRISNFQYFLTGILTRYKDFANAKILRKRTFVKFLDDNNFDDGNPWGDADSSAEISEEVYIVSQKKKENKDFVELELSNPLDIESLEINHRRILGKYCYWQYRGNGCLYEGKPIERQDKQPFTNNQNYINAANYNAQRNGVSYLNGAFEYGKGSDFWRANKAYHQGNIVYKVNTRVRIQDDTDPNKFSPLLVYYVAKRYSIDKDPETHPDYWDKDGCSKQLTSCKKRFKDIRQVDTNVNSKNYNQGVLHIQEASTNNMHLLSPDGGLEYIFNWSTGANNDQGKTKEFTMIMHIPITKGYQQLHTFGERPDIANIFSSNIVNSFQGFRLGFLNNTHGDLVIATTTRDSATSFSPKYYYPLRDGGEETGTDFLSPLDVNLQCSTDLLIILKMKNTNDGTTNKTFSVEVSGINRGAGADTGGIGEQKQFSIKNTFDTGQTLRSAPRNLVWFGGPTKRNGSEFSWQPLNWSHNTCVLAGIVLWDYNVANELVEKVLATRVLNDVLRTPVLRRFEDITTDSAERSTLLWRCREYWSGTYNNGLLGRVGNRALQFRLSENDKRAWAGNDFFNRTNWPAWQVEDAGHIRITTISNISVLIEATEIKTYNQGILPYGGYPGTDGYSFEG